MMPPIINVTDQLNSTQLFARMAPAATSTLTATESTHNTHSHHQILINVIFGIFAVVLAFAALIIAWLQLRKFNHQSDEENATTTSENFELVETQ